jgi:glycerophosphoryl diester phosphodiesterase
MPGRGLDHPYFALPRPWLVAHRGGAALAPENTVEAFANAEALGADAIETDVHLSRDGHVMVFHDEETGRVCGVPGTIEERTRAEIEALDAAWGWSPDDGKTFPLRGTGVRVPALADVLARFPRMRFNVDAKGRKPSLATALARLLRDAGSADRVCVGSTFDETAARLAALLPEWARFLPKRAALRHLGAVATFGLVRAPRDEFDLAALDYRLGWLPFALGGVLRHFARRRMPVQLWTVDRPGAMRRLLRAGVHGVMSDRPDLLKREMER